MQTKPHATSTFFRPRSKRSHVKTTSHFQSDALYRELLPSLASGKLDSLRLIGDAEAPNIIAQAVFSGHLAAREFDEQINPDETPFLRERTL